MVIIELTDAEHYERLDTPFNPPDDSIPGDEFDAEYDALYDRVDPLMAEHGTNDAYGQGDYYLESCIAQSRGLGLEVTNSSIITRGLLEQLQKLLTAHAKDWEIYLRSDNFDYGIFVGADAIRIHRNSPLLLTWLFPSGTARPSQD